MRYDVSINLTFDLNLNFKHNNQILLTFNRLKHIQLMLMMVFLKYMEYPKILKQKIAS